MKSLVITSFAVFIFITTGAQNSLIDDVRALPSVDIKTLDGKTFNSANFDNEGKPMIISFWATWCTPCKKELNNINEIYSDWQKETGVKIIAVSIDDSRNNPKVQPYVDSQAWEYEVYLDPNGDLKRALNVNTIPHTFLVDGNKKIVWQHTSYVEGDEFHLYDEVKKVAVVK
ncbi:MAG: Thiol-disulfide oxidoreductase ResA [Bacteroidia bacterium]|nr:Thiol-disulfide oxidoreductase ResA [Bacteroidia bacterium]